MNLFLLKNINYVTIRLAIPTDHEAVWHIISNVISTGDTYIFASDSSQEKMLNYWFSADKRTYIAEENNEILETFYLKENQMDLGAHVVNTGYMVSENARRKGIGKAMAAFSLMEAKRLGFRERQFSLVVKTNKKAIKLWFKMVFSIIGEIPEAYKHSSLGFVNAYIMYQKL